MSTSTPHASSPILDPWPAPCVAAPATGSPATTGPNPTGLNATVNVPGSKSLTNRYLVLAALADGPSTLHGALRSRDTDLMVEALRELGVDVEIDESKDAWRVTPPAKFRGDIDIFTGLAGTVMRFLPPIAALADGPVRFDGDEAARVRPMGPVLAAMRDLGISVSDDGRDLLPFTVEGSGIVAGGHVDVDASASSQFVSALLLVAPRFPEGLTIRHVGNTLPSVPHIDMTVATLREAGVVVDDSRPAIWQVSPGAIKGREIRIEPDLSNAGAYLAAALAAGGSVSVPGWPSATTQPGALMPGILEQMGASSTLQDGLLTVTSDGTIHGIDLDLSLAGELAPQLAALMTLADSPSRLRGIAHLRGHETDRLAALAAEITSLGGQAEQTSDGLVITPRPLHGGVWHTYHDHRMAHAGAIIGLRVPGVEVENVGTTAKTMPKFPQDWAAMVATA